VPTTVFLYLRMWRSLYSVNPFLQDRRAYVQFAASSAADKRPTFFLDGEYESSLFLFHKHFSIYPKPEKVQEAIRMK
jgi:hypothetical protein